MIDHDDSCPKCNGQQEHICEPGRWPTSRKDRWTCPECGAVYYACRVGDMLLPEAVAATVPSDTLGWRRPPRDEWSVA